MPQLVPVLHLQPVEGSDTMYEYDCYDYYNPKSAGLDSLTGVPTRTTPTLTPTTMRNIEQTFLDLQEQVSHQNQAGFVPPVVQTPQQPPPPQFTHTQGNMMMVDTKSWGGGCAMLADSMSQSSDDSMMSMARSAPSVTPPAPGAVLVAAPAPRRNTGGRRPNKVKNISPEEEERRHVRRERNKMAAARCRKRRLDHTNELIEETEGLEEKKRNLQDEIQQLQSEKEDLEYLLEAHKTRCRLQREDSPPDVKPFCVVPPMPAMPPPTSESDARIKNEQMEPMPRPAPRPRPTTLSVAPPYDPRKLPCSARTTEVAGVPITTPTAGMPFNFESLMDGGTGLTPVSGPGPVTPSCASQQRSGNVNISDLASPDASKLVSL